MPYLDPTEVTESQISAELAAYADLITTEGDQDPWQYSAFEYNHNEPWQPSMFEEF